MEEKIKVTELAITDGNEIIIRTDRRVDPIKLYSLKRAIEDYINRHIYEITDSGIEYTLEDGKKLYVTKKDLERLIKAVYPELYNF